MSFNKRIRIVVFRVFLSWFMMTAFSQFVLPVGHGSVSPLNSADECSGSDQSVNSMILKGMMVYPDNPLRLDFLVSCGNAQSNLSEIKSESYRLIKYFLAGLTIPQNDLWVNLSPYESDRITPLELGKTVLGKDMLEQDCVLKENVAALLSPSSQVGKELWRKVHKKVREKCGSTQLSFSIFNKIWITPDEARVYENEDGVYIVKSHLKVTLGTDRSLHVKRELSQASIVAEITQDTLPIVNEVIIPEIEREVNNGRDFLHIRQIYNSLILAKWYKETITNNILSKIYIDKRKIGAVDVSDPKIKEQLYRKYIDTFKKNIQNSIADDAGLVGQDPIKRRIISGGEKLGNIVIKRESSTFDHISMTGQNNYRLSLMLEPYHEDNSVLTPHGISNRGIYEEPVFQKIHQNIETIANDIRAELMTNGLRNFKRVKSYSSNHEPLAVYQLRPSVRIIAKPVDEQRLLIIKKLEATKRPGLIPLFFIPGENYVCEMDLSPYHYVTLHSLGADFINKNRFKIVKAVEHTFRSNAECWFYHGHLHWNNVLVKISNNGAIEDIRFIDFKHLTEISSREKDMMMQIANGDPISVMKSQKKPLVTLPFEWWSMRGKKFDGLDLNYWGFYNCDLTGATFVGSVLDFSYFQQSELKRADFTNASMMHSVLVGADVAEANFQGVTTQMEVLLKASNILEAKPNRKPNVIYYAGQEKEDCGNKVAKISEKVFLGVPPKHSFTKSLIKKDIKNRSVPQEEHDFYKEWENFLKDTTAEAHADPQESLKGIRHIVFFYPRPFKIGGTKTYQRNVIRSLLKSYKGMTIELIYFTASGDQTQASYKDVRNNNTLLLRGIPINTPDHSQLSQEIIADQILKKIRSIHVVNKIDLICVNSSTPEAYILTKIVLLANELSVPSHYFFHGGAITNSTRFLIEHVDAAVTNSNFYVNIFSKLGMTHVKLLYPVADMPESLLVDQEDINKMKEKYGLFNRKIILHPGRITSKKGQEVTILAAGQLLKEHPDLSSQIAVVIVGPEGNPKGGDRLLLRKLAKDVGVDVVFIEGQSPERMKDWYDAAYVVVYPTLSNEPFGLVPVEAQVRGVPVIVARVGGLTETLKDGVSGYVSEQGNYVDISSKLYTLLVDTKKRNEMGDAGKRYVQERFSREKTMQDICVSYCDAFTARKYKDRSHEPSVFSVDEEPHVLSNIYYERAPIKGEFGILHASIFDSASIYEPSDSDLLRYWKSLWWDKLNMSKLHWNMFQSFTSPFNDGDDVPMAFDPLLIPTFRFGDSFSTIIIAPNSGKGRHSVSRGDPRVLENKIFPHVSNPSRTLFDDPFDSDFVVSVNLYPKVEFDSLIFSKQWQEQRLTPEAVQVQLNWVIRENVITDFHRRREFVPHLHIHLNTFESVPISREAGSFNSVNSYGSVDIGLLAYSISHIALRSSNQDALKDATMYFANYFEDQNYLFTQLMLRDAHTKEPIVVFIIYRQDIKLINFSSIGLVKLSSGSEESLLKAFNEQALNQVETNRIRDRVWQDWQGSYERLSSEREKKTQNVRLATQAEVSANGGIDMRSISFERRRSGKGYEYNTETLRDVFASDVSGFKPNIVTLIPCSSVFEFFKKTAGVHQNNMDRSKEHDIYTIRIPKSYGSIKERFRGSGKKMVVLLRDAHASLEVQKNMSQIIQYLNKKYDFRDVSLEGATGTIDVDYFRRYPHKNIIRRVADKMLACGMLTGAEHASLVVPQDLHLVGVESPDEYRANYSACKSIVSQRSKIMGILYELSVELAVLKSKYYNEKLKAFDSLSRRYYATNVSIEEFLQSIIQESNSNALHLDTSKYVYFSLLCDSILQGGECKKRVEKMIDVEELAQELDNIEYDISMGLAKTSIEKALVSLSKSESVLRKLLTLQALPSDVAYYQAHQKAFSSESLNKMLVSANGNAIDSISAIDVLFPFVKSFYAYAETRSRSLIGHTVKELAREGSSNVSILVSGGYHTDAITKQLRKEKISYVVINPAASDLSFDNKTSYEQHILQERSRYDLILMGGISTLQPILSSAPLLDEINRKLIEQKFLVSAEILSLDDVVKWMGPDNYTFTVAVDNLERELCALYSPQMLPDVRGYIAGGIRQYLLMIRGHIVALDPVNPFDVLKKEASVSFFTDRVIKNLKVKGISEQVSDALHSLAENVRVAITKGLDAPQDIWRGSAFAAASIPVTTKLDSDMPFSIIGSFDDEPLPIACRPAHIEHSLALILSLNVLCNQDEIVVTDAGQMRFDLHGGNLELRMKSINTVIGVFLDTYQGLRFVIHVGNLDVAAVKKYFYENGLDSRVAFMSDSDTPSDVQGVSLFLSNFGIAKTEIKCGQERYSTIGYLTDTIDSMSAKQFIKAGVTVVTGESEYVVGALDRVLLYLLKCIDEYQKVPSQIESTFFILPSIERYFRDVCSKREIIRMVTMAA